MRKFDQNIQNQLESGEIRPFSLVHFTIDGEDYRFTDCDVPITVDGQSYEPRGFDIGTISYSLGKVVDTAQLSVDNIDDMLTPDFVGGTPQGSKVTISLVLIGDDNLTLTSGELATNNSFDTDTDWTKETGWTISAGRAWCDHSSGTADIYQAIAFMEEGLWYRITVNITGNTSGNLAAIVGGAETSSWTGADQYSAVIQAGGTDTYFILRGTDFVGDVSDVSLMEILPPVTLFEGEIGQWELAEGKISLTITNQFSQWNQKTLSNHSPSCRWKKFKGPECGYSDSETSCNRTYTRCFQLNNTANFGGFRWLPSIEDKNVWWGQVPEKS